MKGGPLLIAPCMVLLMGCMKEELPVPAAPRGGARSVQVCMGTGYRDQLWFDLRSGETVSTNVKTAWDLAFESAPGGWRIMLNGSRLMTAWDIGAVDIAQPTDTAGMSAARRIDAASGHPDSTAFGDWRGGGHVYVLDLGYNAIGLPMGLRKVKPLSMDATGYTLRTAQLNGTGVQDVFVPKDAQRTWTHLSLANGTVPIEPPRGAWDLVFTQYTHEFHDPIMPYLVTGVLINSDAVRVARIPNADFDTVALADTLAHPFSRGRDIIGYDWKTYSFETSSYQVDHRIVYIVEDGEGFFFKLHFRDFYGPQGQAGCPVMGLKGL